MGYCKNGIATASREGRIVALEICGWSTHTKEDNKRPTGVRLQRASDQLCLHEQIFCPLNRKGANVTSAVNFVFIGRTLR